MDKGRAGAPASAHAGSTPNDDRAAPAAEREPATPRPGIGDMDPDEFRKHAARVVDWVAEYLEDPERWDVLPALQPGDLLARLPAGPPREPEPMARILSDFESLVPGATTHWNHPGFFAYFAVSGSAPGILAELLSAALNVNAMVWRSGPAATELEQRTTEWLRDLLGLPPIFEGVINDTASSSTLYALAAARESATDLETRELGLAGRADVPALRVYCSEEAHTSVDKAVVTLGLGLRGVSRVATDDDLALDPEALSAAIAEDRGRGIRPLAVVATVGTTSTTALDPLPAVAAICRREGLWLHVDAAYGGAAALVPELASVLDGAEEADSVVVNPHKWLFVPIDCSVLLTRRPDLLRRAFSLTPDYLTTSETGGRNLMDYGLALGRRFRALKLWFVLRWFGSAGIAERIRQHVRLAALFREWVDGSEDFERLAPTPLSVVVFRWRPRGVAEGEPLDALNARLLDEVNATGEVFLSHTRVRGRYAIRLAVGNIRTEERHVRRAWDLLRECASELSR